MQIRFRSAVLLAAWLATGCHWAQPAQVKARAKSPATGLASATTPAGTAEGWKPEALGLVDVRGQVAAGELLVRDPNGSPLNDVTVWVNGEARLTNARGVVALPASAASQPLAVAIEKPGFAGTSARVLAGTALTLYPLDDKRTLVGESGGGLAVNSRGDLQVMFPPGALTRDANVSVTRMVANEGLLPGTLPSADFPFQDALDAGGVGANVRQLSPRSARLVGQYGYHLELDGAAIAAGSHFTVRFKAEGALKDRIEKLLAGNAPTEGLAEAISRDADGTLWVAMNVEGPKPAAGNKAYKLNSLPCERYVDDEPYQVWVPDGYMDACATKEKVERQEMVEKSETITKTVKTKDGAWVAQDEAKNGLAYPGNGTFEVSTREGNGRDLTACTNLNRNGQNWVGLMTHDARYNSGYCLYMEFDPEIYFCQTIEEEVPMIRVLGSDGKEHPISASYLPLLVEVNGQWVIRQPGGDTQSIFLDDTDPTLQAFQITAIVDRNPFMRKRSVGKIFKYNHVTTTETRTWWELRTWTEEVCKAGWIDTSHWLTNYRQWNSASLGAFVSLQSDDPRLAGQPVAGALVAFNQTLSPVRGGPTSAYTAENGTASTVGLEKSTGTAWASYPTRPFLAWASGDYTIDCTTVNLPIVQNMPVIKPATHVLGKPFGGVPTLPGSHGPVTFDEIDDPAPLHVAIDPDKASEPYFIAGSQAHGDGWIDVESEAVPAAWNKAESLRLKIAYSRTALARIRYVSDDVLLSNPPASRWHNQPASGLDVTFQHAISQLAGRPEAHDQLQFTGVGPQVEAWGLNGAAGQLAAVRVSNGVTLSGSGGYVVGGQEAVVDVRANLPIVNITVASLDPGSRLAMRYMLDGQPRVLDLPGFKGDAPNAIKLPVEDVLGDIGTHTFQLVGLDDSMGTSYVTMPDGSTDFPVLGGVQREGKLDYPKLKARFVGTK